MKEILLKPIFGIPKNGESPYVIVTYEKNPKGDKILRHGDKYINIFTKSALCGSYIEYCDTKFKVPKDITNEATVMVYSCNNSYVMRNISPLISQVETTINQNQSPDVIFHMGDVAYHDIFFGKGTPENNIFKAYQQLNHNLGNGCSFILDRFNAMFPDDHDITNEDKFSEKNIDLILLYFEFIIQPCYFWITQNITVDYMDLKYKNYTLANMPITYFFQDKHLIIDTLSHHLAVIFNFNKTVEERINIIQKEITSAEKVNTYVVGCGLKSKINSSKFFNDLVGLTKNTNNDLYDLFDKLIFKLNKQNKLGKIIMGDLHKSGIIFIKTQKDLTLNNKKIHVVSPLNNFLLNKYLPTISYYFDDQLCLNTCKARNGCFLIIANDNIDLLFIPELKINDFQNIMNLTNFSLLLLPINIYSILCALEFYIFIGKKIIGRKPNLNYPIYQNVILTYIGLNLSMSNSLMLINKKPFFNIVKVCQILFCVALVAKYFINKTIKLNIFPIIEFLYFFSNNYVTVLYSKKILKRILSGVLISIISYIFIYNQKFNSNKLAKNIIYVILHLSNIMHTFVF